MSYTRRQDFKEFDFSAFQDENVDIKLKNMIREFAAKLDYKRLADDPNIFVSAVPEDFGSENGIKK